MRNPIRHFAQPTVRTLTLACLAGLLAFAIYSWMPRIRNVLAEGSTPSARIGGARIDQAPLKLRPSVEGDRSINFGESRDLQAEDVGSGAASDALVSGQARPTALASSDFDEDGMPDLLSGYASPGGGGIVTLRRGNVDSVYPNSAAALARKKRGEYVDAPFLSPAAVFELPVAPAFLGAGDFDTDGHWDVVAASKLRRELHFLKGDGRGRLALAQRVALPGHVTALTVGEINRADGLADVVVGVQSEDGARALVFESPVGAMKAEPEVFDLPGAATALGLGLLDEHYAYDLAIAAGSEVQIVIGRDRKLSLDAERQAQVLPARVSRHPFASQVSALAIGDFTGEGQTDVAVLTADRVLQVMRRDALQEKGRRGEGAKGRRGDAGTGRKGDGEKGRRGEGRTGRRGDCVASE